MTEFTVNTNNNCCIIDITRDISRVIKNSGVISGLAIVFIPHTTAGITINENADPDVKTDILMKLDKLVTKDRNYLHGEGNSAAHIKAVMTGFSVNVIIEDNRPLLGTWQGIYLCEYDGPRARRIYVKIISS